MVKEPLLYHSFFKFISPFFLQANLNGHVLSGRNRNFRIFPSLIVGKEIFIVDSAFIPASSPSNKILLHQHNQKAFKMNFTCSYTQGSNSIRNFIRKQRQHICITFNNNIFLNFYYFSIPHAIHKVLYPFLKLHSLKNLDILAFPHL